MSTNLSDVPYPDIINRNAAVLYSRETGGTWGFTFIGENTKRLLGINSKEILTDNCYWKTHVHSDDLPAILSQLCDLRTGCTANLIYRFRHENGNYLWISDELSVVDGVADGLCLCYGSLRDITKHKHEVDAIIESEKRYRRVSDNVRDMVLQVDLKGVAYFASPSHKEAVGINAEDMIGMNAYELVHPDDMEKILPITREAISKRKPAKFEYRSRHADGNYIWTEANASPLIEEDGRISGAILVTRDITEKKTAAEALKKAHDVLEEKVRERTIELSQANEVLHQEIEERKHTEARLRDSEERYRSIVEYTHDGIVIVDEDFHVIYANPEMGLISGYTVEEELGRDFTIFLDKKSRSIAKERNLMRRKGEYVPSVYEVTLIRKGGESRTCEARISLFTDSAGKMRFVVHLLDITERKQSEKTLLKQKQELETKNRELEDLNTALKVLLNQREKDKSNLEENIMANVNGLILPYIEKLKRSHLDERMNSCLMTIEANLLDIVSAFSHQLTSNYTKLTPREIQIANFIREGRDSKEIARLLDLSSPTIEFHRNNLRKKLMINNKKINLRSFLLNLK